MNEKSFEKYFQNELSKIRTLAKDFSKEHPSVAPLLVSQSADPDAERLLEGVSFLTGLLQQKLDDEFPEVIHSLMNILFPHYLRPVPALSILEFTPKPSLQESTVVQKGTYVNSKTIDDTACTFVTTSDLTVYPLSLKETLYKSNADTTSTLELEIESSVSLSLLKMDTLSFYIGDSYDNSSNIFMLFDYYLKNITIELNDGKLVRLPIEKLECDGFNQDNSLFSYPQNAFTGYRMLQEYFVLPQKFFFFNLLLGDKLSNYKGEKIKIIFGFKKSTIYLNSLTSNALKLFCTPIKNLFEADAEPIRLEHKKELLQVRPPRRYSGKYQVYDVEEVSSYIQGEKESRKYFPFESFEKDDKNSYIYQVHRKISIVNSKEEIFLALHYDKKLPTKKEVLSVKITCTNGSLTERLQLGEISQGSDNSPELTTFKNIMPCTMQIDAPIGERSLWQFISHLSVNFLTLADIQTFKKMLKLYIFSNNRDKAKVARNQKQIDAIESFDIVMIDKISRGYLLKGHKVSMSVRVDFFACIGDLYLFCSVILRFLANYASLNSFVTLEVKEIISGESLSWVPILGNRKLI